MTTTQLWQDIHHEYTNRHRRQDPNSETYGITDTTDRMAQRALELWLTELPRREVVRQLIVAGAQYGVLDTVHIIRHGVDLDGPRLIPEGATNRQIIEMIAQAD